MNCKFIRIYKNLDIYNIKEHLLIYGDLSGQCAHCQEMEIELDARQCPKCGADFQYIAFRNIKSHMPKARKLCAELPDVVLVDHDDFKKVLGALNAENFLK
ncbi:MAG: hypothetical protein KAJ18_07170 [Candidatus Omnitrophica bacterium]|nr:hypothetical protein [Candidatus Omnitrophota bacterium]